MKPEKAQLFKNGGSQAVRLPRSVCFAADQTEVLVRKEGNKVILEPANTWPAAFVKSLGAWQDEISRPKQSPLAKLRQDRS